MVMLRKLDYRPDDQYEALDIVYENGEYIHAYVYPNIHSYFPVLDEDGETISADICICSAWSSSECICGAWDER